MELKLQTDGQIDGLAERRVRAKDECWRWAAERLGAIKIALWLPGLAT